MREGKLMKALYFIAAGVAALAMTPAARAQDASWGCQILLCAASKNPSWQGVGYCVPPMQKLISAMKKPGFSWPICEEAGRLQTRPRAFRGLPRRFSSRAGIFWSRQRFPLWRWGGKCLHKDSQPVQQPRRFSDALWERPRKQAGGHHNARTRFTQ